MSGTNSDDVNDFTWLEQNLKTTDTKADKLKKLKKFQKEYPNIPTK
tara:strand:+ start:2339 stop:2476 length:138 start_codon:yes stop_codon:yes gene_type:complete